MHKHLDQYIRALDPTGLSKFCIETYTDAPSGVDKPQPDLLSRRWPNLTCADIQRLLPELKRLNDQGAGVFIAVNEFGGQRSKANLKRIRCVHADIDGGGSEVVKRIAAIAQPTMIVKSSQGNSHLYWCVDDEIDAATAESLNRELVAQGADKAAVDVSRLLRLPGFKHMKRRLEDSSPMVSVIKSDGPRYTSKQLINAFQPKCKSITPTMLTEVDEVLLAKIEAAVKSRAPELWAGQWETCA